MENGQGKYSRNLKITELHCASFILTIILTIFIFMATFMTFSMSPSLIIILPSPSPMSMGIMEASIIMEESSPEGAAQAAAKARAKTTKNFIMVFFVCIFKWSS